MRYWLFKSEPNVFSIDDLKNSPKKTCFWEGVRNYQARNYLRDDVKKGDLVLLYDPKLNELNAIKAVHLINSSDVIFKIISI